LSVYRRSDMFQVLGRRDVLRNLWDWSCWLSQKPMRSNALKLLQRSLITCAIQTSQKHLFFGHARGGSHWT